MTILLKIFTMFDPPRLAPPPPPPPPQLCIRQSSISSTFRRRCGRGRKEVHTPLTTTTTTTSLVEGKPEAKNQTKQERKKVLFESGENTYFVQSGKQNKEQETSATLRRIGRT